MNPQNFHEVPKQQQQQQRRPFQSNDYVLLIQADDPNEQMLVVETNIIKLLKNAWYFLNHSWAKSWQFA
jgi:hypothetical protein